ncbi:MAG: alanine racemase, partial [Candidatus Brocadiaceae bacterium]
MSGPGPGENFRRIRESLPPEVRLVVAAKGRGGRELAEAVEAGARIVGENYVQEAERHLMELGPLAEQPEWHMIGHLQRNKINRALPLFGLIQSLDSLRLARAIDKRAERPVRVLVEINIAGEQSKFGIPPDRAVTTVQQMAELPGLHIEG